MRSRLLILVAVTAVLTASAGCSGSGSATGENAAKPGPILLGTLLPLTGRSSPSGESMRNGAQLAVNEANAAGGVLGRQVELVVEDDACDPGTAVTAARRIVDRDIAASVGGYCSSATVPTLKILRAAGVPMIVAQSNSTDLLAPGYDSVFLICGTVTAEAAFAVGWMKQLGARRLAVVDDGTSFPATLAASTISEAKRTGDPALVAELHLSQGAPSYARAAQAVITSKADVVYYTGYYGEANQFIKDLRTGGYRGKIVVGDGATDGPLLANLTAEERRGVYGTALLFPEFMPELKDWSQRYQSAFGSAPGSSTVEAYDAVNVALDAIKRAGTVAHEAVREAISTTNMQAMSGPMSFNADGTRTQPKFLLLRAEKDGFQLEQASSG
ncbi:branched-chain amino acid ABC transporter substrate-binding protein [Paractinoplanes brasiliensis]|uniref:Amino acid/amide ABC transporter substrate-binding protein (HAAT family) n=1 Tax=Paractinoplanes brasiliensis TaxID=52695 RepID=A0A4R6J7W0_9ACTN|nr:branched-chain amino acid ABC transporter substrate-binding protein [Actinoplanes brasiliensis]TDO31532.1 amino acid/amide ABC transporter substrate-binding protein (HAAT family) [Actinoplanes brasiliensis]GID30930.1 branched chain amino acid ABC transporter substrate-binding protein [Actinoplanes brasiliensis]